MGTRGTVPPQRSVEQARLETGGLFISSAVIQNNIVSLESRGHESFVNYVCHVFSSQNNRFSCVSWRWVKLLVLSWSSFLQVGPTHVLGLSFPH